MYQAGKHSKKQFPGWIKKVYNINGTLLQLQAADLDAFGKVAFVIRNPD